MFVYRRVFCRGFSVVARTLCLASYLKARVETFSFDKLLESLVLVRLDRDSPLLRSAGATVIMDAVLVSIQTARPHRHHI